MKKIIITGGHPSPALAVIEQIKKKRPEWKIYFFGIKNPLTGDKAVSFEYKEITKLKIPFYTLTKSKISRIKDIYSALNFLRLPIGIAKSLAWLMVIKPDIILTFGGYAGAQASIAGSILGIPVVIHEQTPKMGISNKLISLFAKKILLSWADTTGAPKKTKKIVITGLPIRESITKSQKPDFAGKFNKNRKPLIYITGGSQGAHFINKRFLQNKDKFLKNFAIIHQAGESTKYKDLEKLKKIKAKNYIAVSHISSSQLGWILKNSKVIISRAGANIIAELIYFKKRALVIPLAKKINSEQMLNAAKYKNTGLGVVLTQDEAEPDRFWRSILKLNKKKEKEDYKQPSKAADIIVNEIIEIIKII